MAGTIVSDTIQNGAGTSTSTTNVINGCAKAWVNFVGTTGSINASYNVSSVTVTATGQYTVAFTTALTDANYAVVGACKDTNQYGLGGYGLNSAIAQTASSVGLGATNSSGNYVNWPTNVQIGVFR